MKKRIMTSFLLPLVILAGASLAQAQQFNALLFTKTDGWHHDSINAGVTAMQDLAKLHNFDIFWTEDAGRVFNEEALAKYDVVIFLLTTGDVLNDEQQRAFERYIQNGGGYVGVHSASDTEYEWGWYTEMVGYMFHIHPAVQTGVLQVEDRDFPGMDRFANRFIFTEEWYEFGPPRSEGLNFLLSVDETTYDPAANWGAKQGVGMGFHPVSWYHNFDGGRAFYTALGHLPATYGDADFMHHVYGGIYWAATGKSFKAEK